MVIGSLFIKMSFLKEHIIAIIIFVALFALSLTLPDSFVNSGITSLKDQGVIAGLSIVGLILFATTVVAPLNSLALIPIASGLYGWLLTAFVATFSWFVAAIVAFVIARYLGRPALRALGFKASLDKIEKKIPEHVSFWSIVFLRIMFPVDVLSYALGLFSNVSLPVYASATLIGITPFAFIFSIMGDAFFTKNYELLFGVFALGSLVLLFGWHFYKKTQN